MVFPSPTRLRQHQLSLHKIALSPALSSRVYPQLLCVAQIPRD